MRSSISEATSTATPVARPTVIKSLPSMMPCATSASLPSDEVVDKVMEPSAPVNTLVFAMAVTLMDYDSAKVTRM
jgi:hypothetical protein